MVLGWGKGSGSGSGRSLPAVVTFHSPEAVEVAEHACYHSWDTGDAF